MVTAILLAAGVGSRMKSKTAKQFMNIDGHEVLYYSVKAFQNHPEVDSIILVTKEEYIEHCREAIVNKYNFSKVDTICMGGKERYDSVYQGLLHIGSASPEDIVMIHDGARPFVSQAMITDSIACAKKYKACTVGVPAKDTIKIVDENKFGMETPDRETVYQIQTPQTFQKAILWDAYETMYEAKKNQADACKITDDTMLVEQYAGVPCKLVEGAYENIKITTPEDIFIAEMFMKKSLQKV